MAAESLRREGRRPAPSGQGPVPVACRGRDGARPAATEEPERCWAGVNLANTERNEAEEGPRREGQAFETLAENCPNIICRFDLQSRHLYVNRILERVTGLPRARFLGRTSRELGMPADLCAFWEGKLHEAIETRREVRFEFSFQGPSGGQHFQTRLVPEFGPDGGVASILGVCTDVTEL